jgi:gliding motility-associated-like protein
MCYFRAKMRLFIIQILLFSMQFVFSDANAFTIHNTNVVSVDLNEKSRALLVTLSFVTSDYNGVNISCNGLSDGTIDLTPADGVAPYTYLWSNGETTEDISGLPAGTYTVTVTDDLGDVQVGSVILNEPAVISIPSVIDDINCFGQSNGAINITATGGTGTLTYAWSNSATTEDISSLAAGTYTVTVTDANSCTAANSFTVTQPTAINIGEVVSNVNCFGQSNGAINITATGGTGTLTYAWSNSATTEDISSLAAGTYTVTVTDANSCTATNSFTVTQPTAISINEVVSDVNCFGQSTGAIDLTATGGTGVLTYAWSNSATTEDISSLAAGAYTVTVADANSCTATNSFTVTQPTAINIGEVVSNVNCFGQSNGAINITATGGTGVLTYAWSNSATTEDISSLAAGTYTVTVTDANSCTATNSFTVTQPTAISINEVVSNVNCFGQSNGAINITATGGAGVLTYAWSNSATTEDISSLAAGAYTVTVTDANSCTATNSFTVTQPTAISINEVVSNVNCFGQSNGAINITVTGGTPNYQYLWSNTAVTQDIASLSAGTFTVTVTDDNLCISSSSYTVNQPLSLTLSSTITDVTCFGGSTGAIDLSVSGGIGSYTYLWNITAVTQDISGLSANTYTVTVTDDNSCTKSLSSTVNQASAINIQFTKNSSTCGNANGSITTLVSGGSPGYTYLWSNGESTSQLSNIPSGTYTVTVTDLNSCTFSSSTVLANVAGPTIAPLTITNVSCNGLATGSALTSVSGGTQPYNYLWSNGALTPNLVGVVANTYNVIVTDFNSCTALQSGIITQPAAINFSFSTISSTCGLNNGSATVTPSGGVGPYTYLWSNGSVINSISNIAPATYTVTVTDFNSCTHVDVVTVAEILPPTISTISTQNVLCNGGLTGAINVSINNGTASYSYLWNTGAITEDLVGIGAGNYTLTVTDANSCIAQATISVSQPAVIVITGSIVSAACGLPTGSVQANATGGVGGYNYLWSNGANTLLNANLLAGTYTLTVTDANNCIKSRTFVVPNLNGPTILQDSIVNAKCFNDGNGGIYISISGGSFPYSYLWSNSTVAQDLINGTAGSYTVTVTDGNLCTASQTFIINQPDSFSVSEVITNTTCSSNNGSISLTVIGATSPYTFLWSNGQSTSTITNLTSGSYSVIVTDFNLCSVNNSYLVNNTPGVTAILDSTRNPNCFGSSNGQIYISAQGGTPPLTYLWNDGAITQDRSNISAGNYTVTITDFNSCTSSLVVTLNNPVQLSISFSSQSATCNQSNGSATVNASGGSGTYNYLWENGVIVNSILNVIAGNYSVTVTDLSGCSVLDSVNVSNSTSAAIQLTSLVEPSCFGSTDGSLTIVVNNGTPPYTTTWSNGDIGLTADNLAAGVYTVLVTDFVGCTTSQSFNLTNPAPLSLQFISTDANCGQSNGNASVLVSGGIGTYNYLWSTGNLTNANTNLVAATYTVTVTDLNLCSRIDSIKINNIPGPTPVISTIQNVTCFGQSNGSIDISILGGSGSISYLWSNGVINQDLLTAAAGTYTVIVTDAAGCVDTLASTITQPSIISAVPTIVNSSCSNSNGSVDILATGGVGGYNYLWNNGAIVSSISNLSAGTYTVTISDANACSVAISYNVNNTNGAQVVVLQKDSAQCPGSETGGISVNITQGTQPYTYLWSNGDVSANLSNVAAGVYTLTVTDFNNCITLFSDTVFEPLPLSISISKTNATCSLSNGILTALATGGTPSFTYLWSTGNNSSTISGLPAGSYTVTVTDSRSCVLDSIFSITNTGKIQITDILIDSVSCSGGSDGTISYDVAGGVNPYTYTWINTNQVTEDVTSLQAGSYTVIITDQVGCTTSQNFIVGEPSSINVTFPLLINASCGSNNGSVGINVSGGILPYAYLWSNGSQNDTLFSLAAGSYTLTVTDGNGCDKIVIANISNSTGPSITAVDSSNVSCYGLSNGYINITVSGGTLPISYSWTNTPLTSPSITNLLAQTYTVTVTDALNCLAVRSITIQQPDSIKINPFIPQNNPPFNLTCNNSADGEILLGVNGGTAPYTFVWSNGAITQNIQNLAAANYTVVVSDQKGCSATQSYLVSEPPLLVSIAGSNFVVCGESSTFLQANIPTYGIGSWASLNAQGIVVFSDSTAANTLISNLPLGDNIFVWTVSDGKCQVSSQVLVQTTNAIVAEAGIDRSICESDVNLNATQPEFGYGVWSAFSPGVIIADSSKAFTNATQLNYGNNIFLWTVVNGNCRDSASINIFKRDSLDCLANIKLPSAFSPNGDGFNDKFIVRGIEDFPENSFVVFNRWGQTVFESNGYNNDWDGRGSNGEQLADGTYFVILKVKLNGKVYNTYVDLRR